MRRSSPLFFLLGFILLLSLSLFPALLSSAGSSDQFLITLDVPSAPGRSALIRQGYDLWGATADEISFVVNQQDLQALQSAGYRVKSVQPLDFPPDFKDYHDYAEMVAELQDLANRYPAISRLQSVGQSVEGREVWAMRITDLPDEEEPEEKGILIFANMHAREHLTLEQALFLIHDLVENYGLEGEITNLVDQRDIWIIPNLNPDGSEYDIKSWTFGAPYWRKNRRDNGNGTWGVDLNRNFGHQWGCCGGSSGGLASEIYRGPEPFSEPETQIIRDFTTSHPHLTTSLSLHTYGELILYPFGYTYEDLPSDMDPRDFTIFQAMAQDFASRNGYTAQQASDLYIVDGDSDDWLYYDQGLYAFTWELYPPGSSPGFYPPDSVIPTQTQRNRSALRHSIALADDPAKSIGEGRDMSPPEIQILTPAAEATFAAGQPISLTVATTDNIGVTTVEYLLDNKTVAVVNDKEFAATLTLPGGDYELTARAFDAAHWQALANPVTIQVRQDPVTATPTATLTPTPTSYPTESPTPTATSTPSPPLSAAYVFLPMLWK